MHGSPTGRLPDQAHLLGSLVVVPIPALQLGGLVETASAEDSRVSSVELES